MQKRSTTRLERAIIDYSWTKLCAFLFIIGALTLSGCSVLQSLSGSAEQRVDKLVVQQRYGEALKLLTTAIRTDPGLASKEKTVRKAALDYEERVVAEAGWLLEDGEWLRAQQLYDEARQNLPDSQPLKEGLGRLHKEQSRRLDELNLDMMIVRGEWLEKVIPLQMAATHVTASGWNEPYRLREIEKEAEDVARKLGRYGKEALANKNIGLAARTLPLAARLFPTAEINEANGKLAQVEDLQRQVEDERNRQAYRKKVRAKSRKRRAAARKLLTRTEGALKEEQLIEVENLLGQLTESGLYSDKRALLHQQLDGIYLAKIKHQLDNEKGIEALREAQRLLEQFEPQEESKSAEEALQKQLDQATVVATDSYFSAGNSFYSHNQFERAIDQWRQVLVLDPDNQTAQEHIQRAERALSKLRFLRARQNGEVGIIDKP